MPENDRVLAIIGGRPILYAKIAVNRKLAALKPEWLRGRTLEEACREEDVRRFHQRAAEELVREACALEGCEPSDAEVAAALPPFLRDEAGLQRAAAEVREQPEAAARVYRGESLEAVYAEVAARHPKMSLEAFRVYVEAFGPTAHLYLAKDTAAEIRASAEEHARRKLRRTKLRPQVEALAAARGVSFEEAADQFLASVVVRAGVTVVDRDFMLPAGREVFR